MKVCILLFCCCLVRFEMTGASAQYMLKFSADQLEVVEVVATVHIEQPVLNMLNGGIPADIQRGWAQFVTIRSIRSLAGEAIGYQWNETQTSWLLDTRPDQQVTIEYRVTMNHDKYNWNEVGGKDARPSLLPGPSILWVTKGLFVVPEGIDLSVRSQDSVSVVIKVPDQWNVSTAWLADSIDLNTYQVPGFAALTNNLLVVGKHLEKKTKYQNMSITWAIVPELAHRAGLFAKTIDAILPVYRDIFHELPETNYLICATSNDFEDGEAFLNSFHQMFIDRDLEDRKVVWANVLAHEMFHFWNGTYYLRGEDIQGHYWFSEGFTEYYSNLALIRGNIISSPEYYQKLAFQFSRYFNAKFLRVAPQSTLVQAGYEKGKNWGLLYGGGSTTAFVMDVMIRSKTGNEKSLDDFVRLLYNRYGKQGVALNQQHLMLALESITGENYSDFFKSFVNGFEILPLLKTCNTAGLMAAFYQGEFYLKPYEKKGSIIEAITGNSAIRTE